VVVVHLLFAQSSAAQTAQHVANRITGSSIDEIAMLRSDLRSNRKRASTGDIFSLNAFGFTEC
jgi:hypothetical protein